MVNLRKIVYIILFTLSLPLYSMSKGCCTPCAYSMQKFNNSSPNQKAVTLGCIACGALGCLSLSCGTCCMIGGGILMTSHTLLGIGTIITGIVSASLPIACVSLLCCSSDPDDSLRASKDRVVDKR